MLARNICASLFWCLVIEKIHIFRFIIFVPFYVLLFYIYHHFTSTSYSVYIEVLHPAELRTLCHSSLSNFPSPFLSALANILATWKVKVKLKTDVKVAHESESLLLQTSWLPAMLKRDWKWIGKCKRESESPHSYPLLQTSWLPEKCKWN